MDPQYTPDSIYCQQQLLAFIRHENRASIRLIRGPVRLRLNTVRVLAIAIRPSRLRMRRQKEAL